jgi:NADPH:quinone reductase-like Zn-dependent oxidoreductase
MRELTGLSFRDLMVSLGQIQDTKLGWEAAGIVRQVGHKVTRFKTGDRICTLYKGAHRTLVRCKGIVCQQIPDGMSFEEAASIPLTHCTVIQSLIRIAQGKEGQSILIHAAAGGVGQIAVQVAQYLKMEVFATAGSPEKRELLRTTYDVPQDHIMDSRDLSFAKGIMRMTNGRGVDCVLNSLSGEALRQTWHCIAPFGTFIEIGIKDILRNTGLDMEKFLQNTRFASVNIDRIEQTNPMLCAELMEESFQLVRQGVTKLSTHLTVYPASQIEDAFRLMQSGKHSGKIVISLDTEEPVPIWQSSKDSLVLNPDATYLIAGGLGGLGRSLATLMVEHGARNIALISRSGNLSSPAETLIDSLKERKIRVNTYACDIGDAKSLQETVQQISQDLPAVRGVVQSAMVLRDTIFENMSYQQWTEVIHPKVQGSWNLHNTFQEGLDFFIMLSSIAGVTGNMGQGNYAAGGAFQDELAHHRRSLGLPAVTIDLGYMVDVGYVAERGLSAKMKRWESFGMTEAEFHALILTVMSSGHDAPTVPAQVVTGFATGGVVNILEIARPFYFDDTRFAIAAKAGIVEGGAATLEAKPSNTIPMSIRLPQVTSLASATEVITAALIEKLAKLLQCPTMDIDASRPLHHYGVDSLVGAEIRNWLSKECGTEVPQFEVLRSVPISAFAGTVAGKSVFVKEALGQR